MNQGILGLFFDQIGLILHTVDFDSGDFLSIFLNFVLHNFLHLLFGLETCISVVLVGFLILLEENGQNFTFTAHRLEE